MNTSKPNYFHFYLNILFIQFSIILASTTVFGQSGRTYYVAWENNQEIFCSIDLTSGISRMISVLPGVRWIINPKSTYDRENGIYIFQSNLGITTVDVNNGEILNTIQPIADNCIFLEFNKTDAKCYYLGRTNNIYYMYSVNLQTGAQLNIGEVNGVSQTSLGKSTFDHDNQHFTFTSNLGLTVVDIKSAAIVYAFDTSPHASALVEYNHKDDRYYFLSWNGIAESMVSLNPSTGILNTVGILPGVRWIVNPASTFNDEQEQFIFRSNFGITVVDVKTATIERTFAPPYDLLHQQEYDTTCQSYNSIQISACHTYTSPSEKYNWSVSGVYYDTLTNNSNCDSIIVVELVVHSSTFQQFDIERCAGDTVQIGEQHYTQTGTYLDTLQTSAMCDSIIELNLMITQYHTKSQIESICEGDFFNVGSNTYYTSGVYIDTIINIDACDSIFQTTLTVNSTSSYNHKAQICPGEYVTVGQNNYSTRGIYFDTLFNSHLCDSVIQTTVHVHPQNSQMLDIELCQGDSFYVGNDVYTNPGTYIDTLIAQSGCDSVITTVLNVTNTMLQTVEHKICLDEVYFFDDSSYTVGHTINYVMPSSQGCDSAIIIIISQATSDSCDIGRCASYVPNAFSPNNDGINDVFRAYSPDVSFSHLKIYSRWGNLIFESTIDNPTWDGKSRSKEAAEGIYVYELLGSCFTGKPIYKNGEITLVR